MKSGPMQGGRVRIRRFHVAVDNLGRNDKAYVYASSICVYGEYVSIADG